MRSAQLGACRPRSARPFTALLMGLALTLCAGPILAQPFLPGPERNPRGIPASGRGVKRVAAILYRFSGDSGSVPGALQVRDGLFTGNRSVNAYFDEISFGNLEIQGALRTDGDVFGPFTLPAGGDPRGHLPGRLPEIDSRAGASGFVASSYDVILYIHPDYGSGFRARSIDRSRVEVEGFQPVAAAREILHLLGLPRADAVRCNIAARPTVIDGFCSRVPRGDPFDIEGMGDEFRHPNTAFKARMGWYDVSNVATVDTRARKRHSFLLEPIERPTSGLQCLRVPIPEHRFPDRRSYGRVQYYYYVEFRQPSDFEPITPTSEVATGVTVRLGVELDTYHNTFLIDTEPATATYLDTPLVRGDRFVDERSGITIFIWAASDIDTLVEVVIDGDSEGPHLLWTREDHISNLWGIDDHGNYRHHKDVGFLVHYDGTQDHYGTATSYQRIDDRTAYLVVTYENGLAELRVLDRRDNVVRARQFGPYPGWSARGYTKLPDGTARMLWSHENGQGNLWVLDASDRRVDTKIFGPYSGWTARGYRKLDDGTGKLLWSHENGQASLWDLDRNDDYATHRYYGPYPGWTATDYEALPDGTARMLWSREDGLVNLWTLDGGDDYRHHVSIGPYPRWTAHSFSRR